MTSVTVTAPGPDVVVSTGGTRVAVATGGSSVAVSGVGAQGVPGPVSPKGVALEWPVNGEDVTLCYVPYAVTLADLHAVLRTPDGGSCSLELRVGPDRDAAGTVVASADVTDVAGGQNVALTAPDVPAGSYVWFVVTGVSGTVREVHLTLWF